MDLAFAVIGGFGVSASCEPRVTRDIDFGIAVSSDAEAEQLIFGLSRHGHADPTAVQQRKAQILLSTAAQAQQRPYLLVEM